jgi:ankyrin repeat protein
VDSNSAILRTLGVDSPELQLCHESFTTQWRERNFSVKTFQEAYGISGINFTRYSGKVVPDSSSSLGDPRERQESIAANHMNMARFSGINDSGYVKVKGELLSVTQAAEPRLRRERLIELKQQFPMLDGSMIESFGEEHDPLTEQNALRALLAQLSLETQLPTPAMESPGPALAATGDTRETTTSPKAPTSSDEEACLRKLAFAAIDSRQSSVHTELAGTCEWIFSDPTYTTWSKRLDIDAHGGLMWIKGKPGAGKSVMMKKILTVVRNEKPRDMVASFFFNARGTDLERSTLGMFRSLLHQVLRQDPDMRREFTMKYLERCRLIGTDWEYREQELQEHMSQALCKAGNSALHLFIDALDECKEDEVRHVAFYVRELTYRALESQNVLNICISSRRYPTITIARCPELDIEVGNSRDIERYVATRMERHGSFHDLHHICPQIAQKASGVFLWAVLVVDIMHRAWDSGKGISQVERIIHQTPNQVKELFEQLTAGFDNDERVEACRLFQWILFGRPKNSFTGPIGVEQLQYLMLFGTKKYHSFQDLHEAEGKLDVESFRRRIVHISRGLVEFYRAHNQIACQVIHESVRDWLLHENGFIHLDKSIKNVEGDGNVALVNNCIDVLLTKDFFPIHPKADRALTVQWKSGGEFWSTKPVLPIPQISPQTVVSSVTWLAIDNIIKFALDAEESGSIPARLLQLLGSGGSFWKTLTSAATYDHLLRYRSPEDSPLILLCSTGFTSSLSYLVSHDLTGFNQVSPRCFNAALTYGREKTVKTLMSLCSIKDMTDSQGAGALHWLFEFLSCFAFGDGVMDRLIEIFVEAGLDMNSKDLRGRSVLWVILSHAMRERHISCNLLRAVLKGADPNLLDNDGRSILHYASGNISLARYVQELLENKCSPNIADSQGQLPLHLAAAAGNSSCIEALIAAGSAINMADATGSTPLHIALQSGHFSVVNILLRAGAGVDCQDMHGQAPLHLAAQGQNEIVLETMIRLGANTEAKTRMGLTAQDIAELNNRDQHILSVLEPRAPV